MELWPPLPQKNDMCVFSLAPRGAKRKHKTSNPLLVATVRTAARTNTAKMPISIFLWSEKNGVPMNSPTSACPRILTQMKELLRMNKMGPATSKHAHNQSSPRIMGANAACTRTILKQDVSSTQWIQLDLPTNERLIFKLVNAERTRVPKCGTVRPTLQENANEGSHKLKTTAHFTNAHASKNSHLNGMEELLRLNKMTINALKESDKE
jgi:hypothetical protein